MTDRKNEMLEKVRKLLAKANDVSIGDAESEAFRQKANDLMTAYAIDAWEIEMAKEGTRVKPIRRDFSFAWYQDSSWDNPVRSALWNLWYTTANHCRVIQVSNKWDVNAKTIPVVGMEADLDYFDMLFTSLFLQLTMKADPRPSERLSLEENLAAMREAGMGWDTVTRRLIEAGMVEDPNPGVRFPKDRADWKTECRERFLLSERLVRRYRAWCKETNRSQTYTNVKTYREHFANGFSSEIDSRLYEMRRASERQYDASHTSGGAALAVRDIGVVVKEAMWEFFPDLKPHPKDCDCATCRARRAAAERAKNEKRKPVRYKPDTRKIDFAARAAGAQAGREANLHASPQRGLRKTPEIDK